MTVFTKVVTVTPHLTFITGYVEVSVQCHDSYSLHSIAVWQDGLFAYTASGSVLPVIIVTFILPVTIVTFILPVTIVTDMLPVTITIHIQLVVLVMQQKILYS